MSDLDRLAVQLEGTGAAGVVTHGEPHPGNLIDTAAGLVLVDWDTVAVDRPERDLWMIADADATLVTLYRDLTGITLEREALAAYRVLWALADLAAFIVQLRGEHHRGADTDNALAALHSILNGHEPAPYGTSPR